MMSVGAIGGDLRDRFLNRLKAGLRPAVTSQYEDLENEGMDAESRQSDASETMRLVVLKIAA